MELAQSPSLAKPMRMRVAPTQATRIVPIAEENRLHNEFIEAVESHPKYREYRELAENQPLDQQKQTVKYERFLRIADNVALAENLRRANNARIIAQYQRLVAAEGKSLASK